MSRADEDIELAQSLRRAGRATRSIAQLMGKSAVWVERHAPELPAPASEPEARSTPAPPPAPEPIAIVALVKPSGVARRPQPQDHDLAALTDPDDIDGGPDPKIVEVFVCKLRSKMETLRGCIETLRGQGYSLTSEGRRRLNAILGLPS